MTLIPTQVEIIHDAKVFSIKISMLSITCTIQISYR